ncbi:hypothetical protein QUV83_17020 [Cellulomonas cellasea]|nr:hypothetical protein [Cellulomonas cellasea]MDM8086477.1 hypothetical protein [Cellulomonas cellasea]
MPLMQKAVTPAISAAILEDGHDRVSGFVLRAEDVSFATSVELLHEAHGLGLPGSPFRADAPWVDVLRFPSSGQLRFEEAVGGPDEVSRVRAGGPHGQDVPQFWVMHTRVPAGSELVRVRADGTSTPLARFADVGHGWQPVGGEPALAPSLSRFVGLMARWRGAHLAADTLPDGGVVLASESEPEPGLEGFTRTAAGRWRREVPRAEVEELFELVVMAAWGPLPVRVVDQWTDEDGEQVARVSCVGHDADLAESLGLEEVDADVYEANVRMGALQDVTPARLVPDDWASATA